MPELPEVETVRRTLAPLLAGRRIEAVTVRDVRLRLPVDAASLRRHLCRRRVLGLRRRGKYLLADLEGEGLLMVHLGMTGRLSVLPAVTPAARHDHVAARLDDGRELRFNDARRFGLVLALPRAEEGAHPLLAHLGLEPLGPGFDGAWLFAASRGCRAPIKSFLMDARRVVGIGNIYACEALHAAGVRPAAPAGSLSAPRCARLAEAVRGTLERAVRAGGTTLRDFADAQGHAGLFAVALAVYGRAGEPCPRCGRRVRRLVQAGRGTFFCSSCQR